MSLRLQRSRVQCFRTSSCLFIHWRPHADAGLHSHSGGMIAIRHSKHRNDRQTLN